MKDKLLSLLAGVLVLAFFVIVLILGVFIWNILSAGISDLFDVTGVMHSLLVIFSFAFFIPIGIVVAFIGVMKIWSLSFWMTLLIFLGLLLSSPLIALSFLSIKKIISFIINIFKKNNDKTSEVIDVEK